MSDKNDRQRRGSTLADDLDATKWDFQPGKDKKILLRPVGSVFSDLPWEIQPQYLGPTPAAETEPEPEPETDSNDDADTQPNAPLED